MNTVYYYLSKCDVAYICDDRLGWFYDEYENKIYITLIDSDSKIILDNNQIFDINDNEITVIDYDDCIHVIELFNLTKTKFN